MDPLAVSAYGAEQALPLIGTGTGGQSDSAVYDIMEFRHLMAFPTPCQHSHQLIVLLA